MNYNQTFVALLIEKTNKFCFVCFINILIAAKFIQTLKAIMILLIALIMIIRCQSSVNVDLGKKYQIINSARYNDLTIVTKQNIVVISGCIVDYKFDSLFILAVQNPRDSFINTKKLTYNDYHIAFKRRLL